MANKMLEKPIFVQLVINTKVYKEALEEGKAKTGIDVTTTYLRYLIFKEVARSQ